MAAFLEPNGDVSACRHGGEMGMGLERHRRRAREDDARAERGAKGSLGVVGLGTILRGLHCRFAFAAATVAGLLLIAVGAAPQPAPGASDQRQSPETPGTSPETETVEH